MPQQINLCTATFKPVRQRFSAHTVALVLAVYLVVGTVLAWAWVWNLNQASAAYAQTTAAQASELASLKAAILQSRANAAPIDPALIAQLQDRRNAVKQREVVVEAVQQGMFKPGEGHSDWLLMVSRSIPSMAWVTGVKLDAGRFEVDGFTLESAALNEWVSKLAASPLMRHLKLTTVTVENKASAIATALATAPAQVASQPLASGRPVWSFNLTNLEPPAPLPAAAASAGGKP